MRDCAALPGCRLVALRCQVGGCARAGALGYQCGMVQTGNAKVLHVVLGRTKAMACRRFSED